MADSPGQVAKVELLQRGISGPDVLKFIFD
jgi:hypothetical protein